MILSKDQRNAGFSITEEILFVALRRHDKIVKIFTLDTPMRRIWIEADKYFNHKGGMCPYSDRFCQEGWCTNCSLFPEKER